MTTSLAGRAVKIVGPGYLLEHGLRAEDARVQRVSNEGKTVAHVLVDGKPEGALALADIIREESRAAIARLKAMAFR